MPHLLSGAALQAVVHFGKWETQQIYRNVNQLRPLLLQFSQHRGRLYSRHGFKRTRGLRSTSHSLLTHLLLTKRVSSYLVCKSEISRTSNAVKITCDWGAECRSLGTVIGAFVAANPTRSPFISKTRHGHCRCLSYQSCRSKRVHLPRVIKCFMYAWDFGGRLGSGAPSTSLRHSASQRW